MSKNKADNRKIMPINPNINMLKLLWFFNPMVNAKRLRGTTKNKRV
jgi:hypothetical protein